MKTFITLLILFFVLSETHAQDFTLENPGTPQQRADSLNQVLIAELNLDSNQIQSLKAINLKYAQIIQKEILDKDLGKWSMFWKGSSINKEKEKELKALFTDSQWKQYQKVKSKYRSQLLKSDFLTKF